MFYEIFSILGLLASTRGSNLSVDGHFGKSPHIVSIRIVNIHLCSGTILTEDVILGSAHCLAVVNGAYSIQYGMEHITIGSAAPNLITISEVIIHEGYTMQPGWLNDIALAKLETSLSFTQYVQPVKLPEPFAPTPGNAIGVLVGWGLNTTHQRDYNDDIQEVRVTVYPEDECKDMQGLIGPTNVSVQICAGDRSGGTAQCSGDLGSPLFVKDTQVGIYSWSIKKCDDQGYPGVFTKLSSYVNWINQHKSF